MDSGDINYKFIDLEIQFLKLMDLCDTLLQVDGHLVHFTLFFPYQLQVKLTSTLRTEHRTCTGNKQSFQTLACHAPQYSPP